MTPSRRSGWDAILDTDEKILWQGRPDPAFHIDFGKALEMVFGLFFWGFSIFWISMAAAMAGPFALFGLPFFGIGFYMVIGQHFWKTYLRRHTWYTLTNKRAFIATDLPVKGKSLKSWPVSANTPVDLTRGPPDTITFARETRRGNNSNYTVDIGFERIHNGADVYRLMRNIKKGNA
jgi:hypothetical protein